MAGMLPQPSTRQPRLAAAPARRSPSAPTPLAPSLLARGMLPCIRTRLRKRTEPAAGPALGVGPEPRCSCPDRLVLLRSCSFRACRAILTPSASARVVVCPHQGRALRGRPRQATSMSSMSSSQCRLTSSAAFSSTASDVLHAQPHCSRAEPPAAAAGAAPVRPPRRLGAGPVPPGPSGPATPCRIKNTD
jgi:hypothetical protein